MSFFDLDACILPSLEQEEEYIRERSPTTARSNFWHFVIPPREEENSTTTLTNDDGMIHDLVIHYRLGRSSSLIDVEVDW